MKKTIVEKLTERVDEICSDDSGADKPYREQCEKWGKILAKDFQDFTIRELPKQPERIKQFSIKQFRDWLLGQIFIQTSDGQESERFQDHNRLIKFLAKELEDFENGHKNCIIYEDKYCKQDYEVESENERLKGIIKRAKSILELGVWADFEKVLEILTEVKKGKT